MIKTLNDPEKLEQKIRILSRRIEILESEKIKQPSKIKDIKDKNKDLVKENSLLKAEIYNLRKSFSSYKDINSKTESLLTKYKELRNNYYNLFKDYKQEYKPCVYAYTDENNIIVYIGSTQNLYERDKQHLYANEQYFDKNYTDKSQYNLLLLSVTNTIEDARLIEEMMILKYKPRFNIAIEPNMLKKIISSV